MELNLHANRIFLLSVLVLLTGYNTLLAQTTFLPGRAIAVTKKGPPDTLAAYTIYTSNNVGSSTSFIPGASFNSGRDLNGFGFNKQDSMLYGTSYMGDSTIPATLLNVNLFRLNAAGTFLNLGKLPTSGQSNTISLLGGIRGEIIDYTAGVIDSTSRYYYLTVGLAPTGITKLANAWVAYAFGGDMHPNPNLVKADVRLYLCWINNIHTLNGSNMPANVAGYKRLNFNNTYTTGAVQLMLNHLNTTFPRGIAHMKGGMQDFALHPQTKAFYGYISYAVADSIAGRPVVFSTGSDPDILIVLPAGTTQNYSPQAEIAGLHFNVNGQLFGLFNNGLYTRIDLNSGALLNPLASNLPLASGQLWGDMAGVATSGGMVLPVYLKYFTGSAYSGYNELSWLITDNSEGRSFTIEHSADARTFTPIGSISYRYGSKEYHYKDMQPAEKTYYRLLITDADGNTKYSPVILVTALLKDLPVRIYPTIVIDQTLHISLNAKEFNIVVYDMNGKTVLNRHIEQNGNDFILNTPQLAAGSYLIQVTATDGSAISGTGRFIIP